MRAKYPADRADVLHVQDVVRGELHPEALFESHGHVEMREGVPAGDALGRRVVVEFARIGGKALGQQGVQLFEPTHRRAEYNFGLYDGQAPPDAAVKWMKGK